jgi:hypothetical protein
MLVVIYAESVIWELHDWWDRVDVIMDEWQNAQNAIIFFFVQVQVCIVTPDLFDFVIVAC